MKNYSFLFALSFCFLTGTAQTDIEKVTSTISQDEIEGHIFFLADDLLEGREAGTTGNKIAASYLANTLRSYGVKPNPQTGNYYQEVYLKKTTASKPEFSLNGEKVTNLVPVIPAEVTYNGDLVFLNYGLEEDYKGKDVKGKLILTKAGNAESGNPKTAYGLIERKMNLAEEAGAVGVVEVINAPDDLWGYLDHTFNSSRTELLENEEEEEDSRLSYIWVRGDQVDAEKLSNNNESIKSSLESFAAKVDTVVTQNVVGIIEGTDPNLKDEYIMYSAHYDHVGIGPADETGDTIYNGARDNAVGTTTVLSMADNLSQFPTKRSALFIFFTAEEKGLLGSRYYVENPILPLEQVVFGFNSDNAGYNDTTVATIIGLERTTAASHIKEAVETFGLTAIDDPAPEQGLFDRSDNVMFASKGIPAPTFSLGFQAFDGDVTKYYHQPGDEAETLDFDYLLKFFRAYVMAGRSIANDPETPFWTAGDKYEPAGKELYQRQ